MSLGLQATKRRIASVNNTKKITNAMQLVATAKLKQWKKKLSGNSAYADGLHSLMNVLLQSVSEDDLKEIFGERTEQSKTLYIVITSTLGLCGGYNYNLYKELVPSLKKDDILLVIGSKGVSYFKRNGYIVDDTFANLLQDYSLENIRKIKNQVMSYLQSEKVSSVKIVYTRFKNSITFVPTVEDVYPISIDKNAKPITQKEKDMLIEPSPKVVLASAVPLYMETIINSRLIESMVSEQASRSNAMDTATDNAGEIINKLQIQYNKARQQAITQEITEIVGGANAQG